MKNGVEDIIGTVVPVFVLQQCFYHIGVIGRKPV